jgi:hypothetical protein
MSMSMGEADGGGSGAEGAIVEVLSLTNSGKGVAMFDKAIQLRWVESGEAAGLDVVKTVQRRPRASGLVR